MKDDVYEYLREYGFSKEELSSFEKQNHKIYFVTLENIINNLNFLINKNLNRQEILEVIRKDPFMLTVGKKKLEILDSIYLDKLNINKEEIKELILKYPDTYIVSINDLELIIEYLLNKGNSIDKIKELFISKPYILGLDFDEFINQNINYINL